MGDGSVALPDPQRAEIAGVPVWWAPAPGPLTAALIFRVGVADETLATRGVTHLVEHLALFGVGRRAHPHNGFVDLTRCVFHCEGQPSEVTAFLRDCSRFLGDLPGDRVPAERRILRIESSGWRPGVDLRLHAHRYGAAGHGLGAFNELGLRWLGRGELQDWARTRFTRENAAIWLSGEPPDDLELELPGGSRSAVPRAEPIPPSFPAHVEEGTGGVALSMTAPRSSALVFAQWALAERVYDAVRRDAALAYAPYADYAVLGGDLAHVLLGSDCENPQAPDVMRQVWEIVQAFATDGPTEDELSRYREGAHRSVEDPARVFTELDRAAMNELENYPHLTREAWLAEVDALDVAACAAVLREALGTALTIAPSGVEAPAEGFGPIRSEHHQRFEGRTYSRVDGTLLRRAPRTDLVVGDEGVTLELGDGPVSLRWEDVVLVEEGFGAERLRVFGRDETWFRVGVVGRGAAAMEDLRDHLAGHTVVPAAAVEVAEAVSAALEPFEPKAIEDLDRELAELAEVLLDAERLLALSPATVKNAEGLLVVTDQRVVWLCGEDSTKSREIVPSAVTAYDESLWLVPELKVTANGQKTVFTLPRARKTDVPDAVRSALGR